MKDLFILSTVVLALCACEPTDTRTKAANIIYNNCIKSGESNQWCRCIRADLIDAKQAFTEEIAYYIVNGRQHPWLGMTLLGARVRCECRMFPRNVEARGLSCKAVKQIKY